MAQLTWRELSAPDLGNVMRGQQMAGQFINQAITGLQGGLQNYDDATSQRVNAELAARIAAARTPEEVAAIQAGITTDPNASRFTAATLTALGNRPGVLTKNATDALALSDAQYTSGRTRDQNARLDAARPAANALIAAAASGNQQEYQRILAGTPELANLNADQLASLAQGGQTLVKGDLGIEGARIDNAGGLLNNEGKRISNAGQLIANASAQFGLGVAQRNDADNQQGMAASQAVLRMVGTGSAEDARAALATMNLSPGAFNAALSGLEARYPGIYGSNAIVTAPGTGGGNPLTTMNYEARGAGFNAVPANIQTMGQLDQWSKQVNKAGVASSASGPYQIVGRTRAATAQKLFGKGWQDMPYSLENERAIAGAIFDANKGSAQALRNQWVSLSPQEAERVRLMPKDQALNYIAQKESSATPQQLGAVPGGATFSAQSGIMQRQSQNNVGSLVPAWTEKLSDTRTPTEIADELASGALRGVGENANQIGARLQTIMKKTGGNAAQAGEILKQSIRVTQPERGILGELRNLVTIRRGDQPDADSVRRLDSNVINSLAGSVANGSARNQFENNQRLNDLAVKSGNAQSAADAANAALAAATRRAAVDPAAKALLPKYQADANRANTALRQVLGQVVARDRDGTQSATPNRPGVVTQPDESWGFFDFLRPRTGPAGSGR